MRKNRARRKQFAKSFIHQSKYVPNFRGGRRVF